MSYKRPKTQNNFQSLTIAGQVLDKIVLFQWLVMVIWRGEDVQSTNTRTDIRVNSASVLLDSTPRCSLSRDEFNLNFISEVLSRVI